MLRLVGELWLQAPESRVPSWDGGLGGQDHQRTAGQGLGGVTQLRTEITEDHQ